MSNHEHGANCGCNHEPNVEDMANVYHLYSKIVKDNVECLNESRDKAGVTVFRPWDERFLKDRV